jgi:pepF/M3 family oligoendopeptidase
MQTAVTESFEDFRRYYKTKAKFLGKESLPWFDLFAPIAAEGDPKKWTWDEATNFVEEHFSSFSDKMGGMAKRAFAERWVDAEPRDGKRDGAFCMGVRKDESRVLMNFTGSVNGVGTLAHELGHAFHNVNLAERTPLQKNTPMALAETASIFCQTIVTQAALKELPTSERLGIIEADLQSTAQVIVDIHSRFLFEKGVFEGREARDLSVDELNELMLDAQRQTYGDGLDGDKLHPYMWAVKPHYYGASYYNWPYTFGELFGTGLYSQYLNDPEAFRGNYDDLLSSTGLADAAELCSRFDIDITKPDFWRSSLDVVRGRIDEFVKLAG